jgi:large subunit ribosomal protein L6
VKVPSGVKVVVAGRKVKITGPVGTQELEVIPQVAVTYDDDAREIKVTRRGEERFARAMHGTTRAHLANMVEGVNKGFAKSLAIFGTGYSVEQKGANLVLKVGFGHPVTVPVPADLKVEITAPAARGNDTPATLTVRGPSRWSVGQFTASLRAIRPPEPYLGKGIRYQGEQIKRKVGKAFGSA